MDSEPECKTPRTDEKMGLFTPSNRNISPSVGLSSSSKNLLTPCRQVGLRRRSIRRVTSSATTKTEITPTSHSSPVFATNESKCTTTPKQTPLKKRKTCGYKSILADNHNCHVIDESVKEQESKNAMCNNKITVNSSIQTNDGQCEGSQSEISNSSALTAKEESTHAVELTKPSTSSSNNECEFNITLNHPILKKCSTPRCKMVGERNIVENENKSGTDRTAHSSSRTKDIHWSSISKIPVANDFSHVIKTVPVFGEIKDGEDLTERLKIMKQYIKEQKEQLRLLKLARTYSQKYDPEKMAALINKWKKICQALLYRLQKSLASRGQPMTMAELIAQFGFEHSKLNFNPETDDFD